MPNFYVAQQNTFNGDGTTQDAATFDGGVGASNDFKGAVTLTPAYGSIIDTDTVHVKAYGSDPALYEWDLDISTASLTISVMYISVDMDGNVWGDSTGHFVIGTTATSKSLIISNGYGHIYGLAYSTNDVATYTGYDTIRVSGCTLEKFYVYTAQALGNYAHFNFTFSGEVNRFISCVLNIARASISYPIFNIGRGNRVILDGCVLDFSRTNTYTRLFTTGDSYGNSAISCINGTKVLGAHLLDNLFIASFSEIGGDYLLESLYCDVDVERQLSEHALNSKTIYIGEYDGQFGFRYETPRVIATWRKNQNFPTLNALLPDGVTPWSVRVLPATLLTDSTVADMTSMKKLSGTATEQKTITTELVINDTFLNPLDTQWWTVVSYIDWAGNPQHVSSYGSGSPLTASLAQWNPLSNGNVPYGVNTYNRYKLEVTTPTNVMPNSIVSAIVYSNQPSVTTEDFYFICPDISIVGV